MQQGPWNHTDAPRRAGVAGRRARRSGPLRSLSVIPRRPAGAPAPAPAASTNTEAAPDHRPRSLYLWALTWAFTLFNSVRVLAYLPTLWAIHHSGDSSQHSLWTWCTWLGANLTMAAWLHESNGRRVSRAVVVNACNATMCLLTVALIVGHRL